MLESNQLEELKHQIDNAEVISFDVFDTLIKRIVNTPETVFELLGIMFDLYNFKTARQNYQMSASEEVKIKYGRPHANIDDIYEYFEKHDDKGVDWQDVKQAEIQMEKDAAACNFEMLEVFKYAKAKGKRVIATSDMYLFADTIKDILEKCGYGGIDRVYVSSNENATKYEGMLFELVRRNEEVAADRILHIGDNYKDDYEHAISNGLNAFFHKTNKYSDDMKYAENSPVDYGTSSLLLRPNNDFWYNFGVYAGGPLYLGLYDWMLSKIKQENADKVYFISRDGYNLYKLLKSNGCKQAEYLYTSRRALLLAGIVDLDDETLSLLPPFTLHQSVEEILEYLDINDLVTDSSIEKAGFSGRNSLITGEADKKKFKNIYRLNEAEFLKKCKTEREDAKLYFEKIGFFEGKNILFDCGWNGSSQYLLDRFLNAINCENKSKFFYAGIMDTDNSRHQLREKLYETYFFNFDENINLQQRVVHARAVMELLFSAPHESVLMYCHGEPIMENTEISQEFKDRIFQGISDYLALARPFIKKYGIEISAENAIASLTRLINHPTLKEAEIIGDIANTDGFANKKGEKKYIAQIDEKTYDENPDTEIYWIEGLMTRKDIKQELKEKIAADRRFNLKSYTNSNCDEVKEKSKEEYLRREYENSIKTPYMIWIEENESNNQFAEPLDYNPRFSLIVPVCNADDEYLNDCILSVKNQTYTNWELLLTADVSSEESAAKALSRYENDEKIHVLYRQKYNLTSSAVNDALKAAAGDFVAFLDCDDVLAPNALYEMAKKLNENSSLDLIYSDEDEISKDSKKRYNPFFKPDWSPDTFMSFMYTNHLSVYRATMSKTVGLLNSESGDAWEYDFALRFSENTDNSKIGHISKVLYHCRERIEKKPFSQSATKKVKENMLARRKINGHIESVGDMSQYRVVYEPNGEMVSIIIPSKNNIKMLFQCINSIIKYTDYPNYEIIIVDNGSNDANRKQIEEFIKNKNVTYCYQAMQFNYSKMCNAGRRVARGDLLLYLNDDTEIFQSKWLSVLTGHALQKNTGVVGAKLLYPESNIIQHAGVTNLKIGPSHTLKGFRDSEICYFGRNRVDYNYLAVTGACFMMAAKKFDEVGGFDENLPVAYNDVDLCFRLYENGYYNVLRNDVMLYHYEFASRGDDIDESKQDRLWKELETFERKHPNLRGKDPFYNINLTNRNVNFEIKEPDYDVEFCEFHPLKKLKNIKKQKFKYCFDKIECNEHIVISGWYFTGSKDIDENSDLRLVFKDNLGNLFESTTQKVFRPDVAAATNSEAYFTGFECLLPKNALATDYCDYEIACSVQSPNDNKRLFMWTDAHIGKECNVPKDISDLKKLKCFDMVLSDDMECSLEELKVKNGLIKIKGWAYPKSESGINCQVSILLKDSKNNIFKAETDTEPRFDVAISNSSRPWMLNSGFCATIKKYYLEYGEEYCIGILIRDFSNSKNYLRWSDNWINTSNKLNWPEDETDSLQAQIYDAKQLVAAKDKVIQEMYNSSSWKMTRIFRRIKELF